MLILPGVNSKLITIISDQEKVHTVYCNPVKIMINGKEIWNKK